MPDRVKPERSGRTGAHWTSEVRVVQPTSESTGNERIVPDEEWDNPTTRANRRTRRAGKSKRGA